MWWLKKHAAKHAMIISKFEEIDRRLSQLEERTMILGDTEKELPINPYGYFGKIPEMISVKEAIYAIKKYLNVRIEKHIRNEEIVAIKSDQEKESEYVVHTGK